MKFTISTLLTFDVMFILVDSTTYYMSYELHELYICMFYDFLGIT